MFSIPPILYKFYEYSQRNPIPFPEIAIPAIQAFPPSLYHPITWYEPSISEDNCTMIIQKYSANILKTERIYQQPILLQNPFCKPPTLPPPQIPSPENSFPSLSCSGEQLILRIPTYIYGIQQTQAYVRFDDFEEEVTGELISVNFPIGTSKLAEFTINWTRKTIRKTQRTSGFDPLYGTIHVRIPGGTVQQSITYQINRDGISYSGNGYFVQKLAQNGDSFAYSIQAPYAGGLDFAPDIRVYIGSRARIYYDSEFNNPGQINGVTGQGGSGASWDSGDPQYLIEDRSNTGVVDQIIVGIFTQCYESPVRYGEPPPIPPPDMTCCPQNDQLLRAILAIVKENQKRIGELPAQVPNSLTAKNPSMIKINSLAEYIAYGIIQMDSLVGQFPLEMEVEDFDLTKEGNQKQKFEMPNMAEMLAEMLGLLITLKRESQINVETGIKSLIESGQAKQAATVACDIGLSNAEYLGYKLAKKTKKIALSYTPNEQRMDKFLKEKELTYATYDNIDDADLKDALAPIMLMAARWSAQNFVRLPADGATAATQLKKLLSNPEQLNKAINDLLGDEAFKEWAESVEDGYTDDPATPANEQGKPYGGEKEARPKIRKLGEI
ncbi:MAG TPA: hypothetical protein VE956_13655 [Nodularia sp. (in: cyanobacteria)]|nr:hypothetical protein [Nodularia sp. (in: cyanobacteria)]